MSSTITATTASTRSSFTSSGFQPHLIPIPAPPNDPTLTDLEIYALRFRNENVNSKEREPLLLIHGHPQNLSIWHRVAPTLAKEAKRDIILVDLRGYGHSGVPRVRNFIKLGHENQSTSSSSDQQAARPKESILRERYSKREMGKDLIAVMKHFQYEKFAIVGHDRGGRVAHRMALDYPELITKVMTLDIVPTFDLYQKTDSRFALAYWHWFFLVQDYPMPEEMIIHSPKTYLDKLVTRFPKTSSSNGDEKEDNEIFPSDVLQSYLATLSSPPRVHAICEDYRCSAPGGIDFETDKEDREKGKKISQPFHALWGKLGVNQALFGDQGPIDLWQNVCNQKVSGKSIDCGHYMPEEAPKEIIEEILTFFT